MQFRKYITYKFKLWFQILKANETQKIIQVQCVIHEAKALSTTSPLNSLSEQKFRSGRLQLANTFFTTSQKSSIYLNLTLLHITYNREENMLFEVIF